MVFTTDDVDEEIYNFGIQNGYPLPDGTVLVEYDLASESAGDETPRRPRHAVLGADGELTPVQPTTVDGVAVDPSFYLLAAGPDGRGFFWDRGGDRVLVRSAAGVWTASVGIAGLRRRPPPALDEPDRLPAYSRGPSGVAAVGPDGSLFLEGLGAVFRISPDGAVSTVVDVQNDPNEAAPRVPLDQLPLPVGSVTLPELRGMTIGLDGTVFVSTRSEVLAIDRAGMLSLVVGYDDLQTELGIVSRLDPPYLWGRLGTDADGSVLVSDGYQQLLVDLEGPVVLLRQADLLGGGLNASFSPGDDLLLRLLDPDRLQAGPSDPDRLVVFGR